MPDSDLAADLVALRRAAWLALAAHALAAIAMLAVLRHGLPAGQTAAARTTFVGEHVAIWRAAWLAWSVAAVSFLLVCATLAAVARARRPGCAAACRLAPLVCASAVAVDLSAQMLEMTVLPELASAGDAARFALLERIGVVLSGGLANALYTLACALLAWSLRPLVAPWVTLCAALVLLGGGALTVSACTGSATAMVASNVVLVPSLLGWLYGLARLSSAHQADVAVRPRDA